MGKTSIKLTKPEKALNNALKACEEELKDVLEYQHVSHLEGNRYIVLGQSHFEIKIVVKKVE